MQSHKHSDSPLLQRENQVGEWLVSLYRELRKELDRLPQRKVTRACRRQLRLLKKGKYNKIKSGLIERCKEPSLCLVDEFPEFLDGLFWLVAIPPYTPMADSILTLVIRIVYADRKTPI